MLPASLSAGVLLTQWIPFLAPFWLIAVVAVLALFALKHAVLRWAAVFLLAWCWTTFNYAMRMDDRLEPALAGQLVSLRGVISAVPAEYEGFTRFRIDTSADDADAGIPETILAYWYREWPELSPGQKWEFELKLRPPWGRVNFQGADRERWLFAQGIGAVATVSGGRRISGIGSANFPIESARSQVLVRIAGSLDDERERGVIQALATADRSGLSGEDRRLLRVTGTSHLLAISGLHIGLAAAGGMWLGRLPLGLLPVHVMGRAAITLPLAAGLLSAMAYSALAGFGVPTLRAVLMLCAVMAALLGCRAIHPLRAWAIALAAVLLIDPFAPLGAGFWFSFLAVAALLGLFLPRNGREARWKMLFMAQGAVIIVLLPLGVLWFQSFSPSAFAANLVAIPWVSLLVVPLVLAGLALLPLSGAAAAALWSLAGAGVSFLFRFLEWIDRLQGQLSLVAPPSALQAVLAVGGAFVLLLPRGVPARWLGGFLLLLLFLPPGERTPAGTVELEVLDAGQGTAVVVSSGGRSLLYDSGPGDGAGRDLVTGVIAPALARHGRDAPRKVIISHGDLDHAGGLKSLLELYPEADYRANLPDAGNYSAGCRVPMRWRWPGVKFRVLHPSRGLPYLGNDSSCVLSVASGLNRLLLSGDISINAENRLLENGLEAHRAVLVPHHGSRTSSGESFLRRLEPVVGIATAGLGNRFGFPRAEIRNRYENRGASFWSTGECGALRLLLHPDGRIEAESARRLRNRVWRWPAGGNCP